jgi:hypothetical protein
MARQQPVGLDLPIVEVSRSHSDTPLSVGSSGRRYRYTQRSHETDIHAPGGIWTHIPCRRDAADPCHRPRGLWDRRTADLTFKKLCSLSAQCGHVLRTILITEIIFLKCISFLFFITENQCALSEAGTEFLHINDKNSRLQMSDDPKQYKMMVKHVMQFA